MIFPPFMRAETSPSLARLPSLSARKGRSHCGRAARNRLSPHSSQFLRTRRTQTGGESGIRPPSRYGGISSCQCAILLMAHETDPSAPRHRRSGRCAIPREWAARPAPIPSRTPLDVQFPALTIIRFVPTEVTCCSHGCSRAGSQGHDRDHRGRTDDQAQHRKTRTQPA
jgi:hypothetical protein